MVRSLIGSARRSWTEKRTALPYRRLLIGSDSAVGEFGVFSVDSILTDVDAPYGHERGLPAVAVVLVDAAAAGRRFFFRQKIDPTSEARGSTSVATSELTEIRNLGGCRHRRGQTAPSVVL